jgi:hypothetical protein
MDSISFIFKRFFYSFLSGCIIIFYAIIYYYALQKTSVFPQFFEIIINFIRINSSFVFIIFAIFLSIIIEGICQIGLECYLPLYDKEKKYIGKRLKDFKICKEKCEYIKFKIVFNIINIIYVRPSILWVCKCIKETDFNPMGTFIKDSGLTDDKCLFFNCNLNYNAVYICARVIEREKRINNIYYYRDNSYIIQMLRLSFLCIVLTTFFSGIILYIFRSIKLWEFNSIEDCKLFFIFISSIFIISIIVFFCLSIISRSFAKRFIREVGYTYEAMRLNLPLKKNGEYSAIITDEE